VVFIHGAAGSRLFWPPAMRRLPGVEVFALDLPGHGASPGAGASSIREYAEAVRAWMSSLDLRPAVLVGHSMGSAIALTLARSHPEMLAGLVLIGSGAALRVNPTLLDLSSSEATVGQATDLIVQWSFGAQASPGLVDLARRRMAPVPARILHQDLRACEEFDLRTEIGRILQPSLIVCGAQDRMTPPKLSQALAETLPRNRLRWVEGAGHMVMLEQPSAVVGEIRAFLAETFPAV
jgi:pimeloyl-ACP methyl ester carboxylesterase